MASRPAAPPARAEPPSQDTCGQGPAKRLLGTVVTPQARTTLVRAVGHDRIRVIRPGSIITQDLRSDRLNLIVDDSGRLLTARCG
ncbi:I78 family peptidase inhibitor [Novosphingobium jiangmenense]|nr:I78 family peptidase inhibitor [Novosphingobium jiangmenense]